MPVTDYASGDHFVVTIKKNLLSNPENSWVNRYETEATAAGGVVELENLMTAILLFEQALHSAAVFFSQMSCSTWAPDSKPYNPATFISTPISVVGTRVVALDLQPLDKCLSVARVAASGRAGHLFYRGALYEDEVSSPAGKSILTSPTTIAERVQEAIISSELENRLGLTPPASPHLVMINKTGTQVRNVISLVPSGVSTIPTDHAWFNRTSTP